MVFYVQVIYINNGCISLIILIGYKTERENKIRNCGWRMTYISTHDNVADLLTKSLIQGNSRIRYTRWIVMCNIPSTEWHTM